MVRLILRLTSKIANKNTKTREVFSRQYNKIVRHTATLSLVCEARCKEEEKKVLK